MDESYHLGMSFVTHPSTAMEGNTGLPQDTKPTTASVQVVSVKLPEFYVSDPATWFLCAETQFGLHNVTQDDTCFWHVLSAPDTETSALALHVASKATPGENYSTLKNFLVKTLSPSHWEQADCILTTTELGDRRPSALANHLLTLLGNHSMDILIQHIFLRCLPTYIQGTLASSDITAGNPQ